MREAIDAGKIGRPALGVALMFNWRDEAYYRSDPWRGRWETEGGGVLVNQAPHQLDLLRVVHGADRGGQRRLGEPQPPDDRGGGHGRRDASGSGAAGSGRSSSASSQRPGLFSKVHVHGTNGASIGVETDRGATFVAGVSAVAEPPLNDLWTIPGEEDLLAEFQAEDRGRFAGVDPVTHTMRSRSATSSGRSSTAGRRW